MILNEDANILFARGYRRIAERRQLADRRAQAGVDALAELRATVERQVRAEYMARVGYLERRLEEAGETIRERDESIVRLRAAALVLADEIKAQLVTAARRPGDVARRSNQ